MSEKELKPCPFCGSVDLHINYKIENGSPKTFMVVCLNCFAEGPFHYTENVAISAWNMRGGK